MARLVCDHCGAHHTRDVAPGQVCAVCDISRLRPIDPVPPRRNGGPSGS
jgi:hypothetical protein